MAQLAYILTTRASYNAMLQAYADRDAEAGNDPNRDVWRQIQRGAVQTGYWKDQPGDIINLHVIGSESAIQSVIDYLSTGVSSQYWWDFDGTVIVDKETANQHNEILLLHKDHADSEPASFERPNWGHGFAGQGSRAEYTQRFARSVSNGFGKGIG